MYYNSDVQREYAALDQFLATLPRGDQPDIPRDVVSINRVGRWRCHIHASLDATTTDQLQRRLVHWPSALDVVMERSESQYVVFRVVVVDGPTCELVREAVARELDDCGVQGQIVVNSI